MAAYVIIDIDIHDKEAIVEYQKRAVPAIEAYNGKFVVRGGAITNVEGNWNPSRIVIIEFSSRELAEKWWSSTMYSEARSFRHIAAYTDMIIVDGI